MTDMCSTLSHLLFQWEKPFPAVHHALIDNRSFLLVRVPHPVKLLEQQRKRVLGERSFDLLTHLHKSVESFEEFRIFGVGIQGKGTRLFFLFLFFFFCFSFRFTFMFIYAISFYISVYISLYVSIYISFCISLYING